jgi:hypothetical protein
MIFCAKNEGKNRYLKSLGLSFITPNKLKGIYYL